MNELWWDRLRMIGWAAGLLALALSLLALTSGGNPRPPTYVAVVASWLIIACAPPKVRALVPLVAVTIGLTGIMVALADNHPGSPSDGLAETRFTAWRASLLLQSCAFLAVGIWLIWRRGSDESAASRGDAGQWLRRRAGLLLVPAAALLVILIDQQGRQAPLIAVLAAAAMALVVVVGLPAAAPDLAAAGLTALGVCALSYVISPPPVPVNALTVSPGVAPYSPAWASVGAPFELVAGVQGAAILALGLWLVPRTIGVHARALLWPDAELAGRVEELTQTRADAVDGAAAELRRVERDLHDGAQARLVALGMNLRAAERLIPTSPQAAIALVAEAREASAKALTELRDLVRGVHPPVLADRGLADAIRALALDTPIGTETDIDLPGRLDPPVETACYFAVAEALANAVKHSGARLVQIRIRHSPGPSSPYASARSRLAGPPSSRRPVPGVLRIEVTDDGTGGADPARGTGLQGVERRLGTFDGILAVNSPPGGPTMIIMEVPCALSSPRTSSC
jgi:signal transduction histidine kinase